MPRVGREFHTSLSDLQALTNADAGINSNTTNDLYMCCAAYAGTSLNLRRLATTRTATVAVAPWTLAVDTLITTP